MPPFSAPFLRQGAHLERVNLMREAYLDNSATTQVSPEVAKVIYESMCGVYGNPSSLHSKGLEAELELEKARETLSAAMGAKPQEVYFTSGGSEGNNAAIYGLAQKRRRFRRVVISGYEHPSVERAARRLERDGFEIVELVPGADGRISPETAANAVDNDTAFVSVMFVNNETGAINDISGIAKAIKRKNPDVPLHTDAVQAFGKLRLGCDKLGAQVVTVSGHKLHAPKGIGAMYIQKGFTLQPFIVGGGQQSGQRSGTEPVAMAVGLALAAQTACQNIDVNMQKVRQLRERLLELIGGEEDVFLNSPEEALPYIVNISAVGIRSEIMLHYLERRGIYVSSGSACSKGAKSHVLAAAGLSGERIDSALRISFSAYNTQEDVEALAQGIHDARAELKR